MQFSDGGLAQPKRLRGLSPLGDIERDADIVGEKSCLRIPHRKSAVPDPADGAIRPDDPVFLVERDAVPVLSEGSQHVAPVVRMNGIYKRFRIIIEAGAGAAPYAFICRADVECLADFRVGRPDDLFNGFCDLAKTAFALLERLLGSFPVADILNDGNKIRRRTCAVADLRYGHVDPYPRLVASVPSRFHGKRRPFAGEQLAEL